MIGKRLRLLREKEGISQERLGEILGVVRSQISMYESDERDPSPEVLLKIHKHYNCSIDYLFGLKDEIYIGSQKPVPIEEAMTLLTKEEWIYFNNLDEEKRRKFIIEYYTKNDYAFLPNDLEKSILVNTNIKIELFDHGFENLTMNDIREAINFVSKIKK